MSDLKSWMRHFKCLERFVEAKGRIPTPLTIYEQLKIGDWVQKQLRLRQQFRLFTYRAKMLKTIKGWHWLHDSAWMANYTKLKACKRRGKEPAAASALGRWLARQKSILESNSSSELAKDKISLFKEIGV